MTIPFFDFNYITDPPNDELVNEQTQLNDNWQKIDDRLGWMQGKNSIVPPDANKPLGLEVFTSDRHVCWSGTGFRAPTSIEQSWSAWTQITYTAPYQASAGFPVEYRTNSANRYVQMRGRIQNGATGTPFGKTAWIQVGTIAFATNTAPMFDESIHTQGCNGVTGSSPVGSEVAGARVRIRTNGVNPVIVEVNYMGQDGSATNQYIAFDGLEYISSVAS